jgi:competence protein ComEC
MTGGPPRSPPIPPDVDADPDADGVALAAATAAGVLLGARFPVAPAWVAATVCLVVATFAVARAGRRRVHPGNQVVAGVLVLGTLLAAGGAAASVRATAVRRGVLVGWVGRPGRVEVAGAVAEEPRQVRYGGYWVVLAVDRVRLGGRLLRTRERAGLVLGREQGAVPGREQGAVPGREPGRGGGLEVGDDQGRLAVGERLRVRASVAAARWGDPLGREPRVLLRRPVIEERAPPRGGLGGAALRGSEVVRDAARRRALATLAPERAGLLVGMALGDTSLLPGDLERDFRAAGLTHLMAVSGAYL